MSTPAQLHGSDELGWLIDMAQVGPVTTGDGGVLSASACQRAKVRLLELRAEVKRLRRETRTASPAQSLDSPCPSDRTE